MRTVALALLLTACGVRRPAMTPLVDAVRTGDAGAVRTLIARGADPNEPSGRNQWTPLLHAVHTSQLGSAAALLDGGADPNRPGPFGDTALMMAAGYADDDMVALLLRKGADPARRNPDGDGALDFALSGMTDIDRFTFFRCNDSTAEMLAARMPTLRSTATASSRRWARIKGCTVTG
jgi:ankyrin repeat protein